MQNLMTQIQPLVKIRRNRSLPVSGTVLVHKGQKVTSSEVLAEGSIPKRHFVIDVIQALGLKKSSEAEKLNNRKVGEQLDKNDIVVETGGLFSRVIRAPMPGKIVSIKNGQIILEIESQKVIVQSGLTGHVVEILKDHGAVVEANCTLIQGVWGNGKIGYGPYLPDTCEIDEELLPASLSITSRGTVVVAAFCEKEETLIAASNLPVGGLILGSMNPSLITCAQKQNYPIILLEGFGKTPINDAALKVILDNTQREMCLNAMQWDHFSGMRPEICITVVEEGEPEIYCAEYAEGQIARIHTSPYAGQLGVISSFNQARTALPNGLRTATASIILKDKQEVIVPLSNFDIINIEKSTFG
jgi:hypothetical protein